MKFSRRSIERLNKAHPKLKTLFENVIEKTNIDFGISCSFRSLITQKELFETGHSKVLNGKHNHFPSLACDIFLLVNNKSTWDKKYYYYFAGFVKAEAKRLNIDIRWGGDWDGDGDFGDQTFNDLCHFELQGV